MNTLNTNMKATQLLKEFKIGSFDNLYKIAIFQISPSRSDLDDLKPTDLFAWANPETQEKALNIYPEVRRFEADQFKLFMEEAYDLPFEDIFCLENDKKIEAMDFFGPHNRTKQLAALLQDESFNPLYFTSYSDGLAVMFVQDPVAFRQKIIGFISKLLLNIGIDLEKFIQMPFEEQKQLYTLLQEVIYAEESCLDWTWPEKPFVAAT